MNKLEQKKIDKAAAKKSKRKSIISFLCFAAINVGVIAYLAIKEFGSGAKSAKDIDFLGINMFYIIAAAGCFGVMLLTETLKYEAMLRASDGRSDMKSAFEVAVLGKYYDNITPLGSGGQPFQVYYLKKKGFSTGTSASLPIAGFLVLQFAFILIAAVVFLFNPGVMPNIAVRVTAYVGLMFYAFIPTVIILFTLMPKIFGRIITGIIHLLAKLHFVKDGKKSSESFMSMLFEYRDSLIMLTKYPFLLIKTFSYSLLYQIAVLSIPFFVLRAFGGATNWITVLSLCVFISAAITFIPTPGNSGAAEGSFYAVFSSLTSGYLFWAVLVWRFFCYYSFLLAGLALYAANALRSKRLPKKHPVPKANPASAQFTDDVLSPELPDIMPDGTASEVCSYARLMSKNAYSCVVCSSGKPFSADLEENTSNEYGVFRLPLIHLPFTGKDLVPAFGSKKLMSLLKSKKIDIIHVHTPFAMGRYAVKLGRKLGIPVIATFKGRYEQIDRIKNKFFARLAINSMVTVYCQADAVWAPDVQSAEILRSYGFNGQIEIVDTPKAEMLPILNLPAEKSDVSAIRSGWDSIIANIMRKYKKTRKREYVSGL